MATTTETKLPVETPLNGLAVFIRDVQFKNWRTNRKETEKKWERNRKNFHGIVSSGQAWKEGEGKDWRSNTFVRYTKQKVMAAFSQVIDFLLQNGRIPFDITPSKWDEFTLSEMEEVEREYTLKQMNDQKNLIDQQLYETKADRSLIKNVMSACVYGETYAKVPVEEVLRKGYRKAPIEGVSDTSQMAPDQFAWEPFEEIYTTRAWKYVANWNIFRDTETNDLRECQGVLHREMVSPYWLRQQMGLPYWLDLGIEEAITQSANQSQSGTGGSPSISADASSLPPVLRDIQFRYNTLEYIEYWGRIPRAMAEEFETWLESYYTAMRDSEKNSEPFVVPAALMGNSVEQNGDEVEVMVAMAEQYIVRYVRTTKDQRPFEMAIWDQNVDEVENQGVADNVEDMQKVINGAFRAIEDNKKLSANVILAIKSRLLENMPKSLKPGERIEVSDEVDDVRMAIQPILIPDIGSSLIDLLQIAFQVGDEDSMIPKIQQGFQEAGSQTAFQIAQQLSKAGKYLGQAIKNFDEGLIEPIVTRFYDYNMMNPEIDIGKGSFSVDAQGFQSYQNRSLKLSSLNQLLMMALQSPTLEQQTNIRRIWEDIVKALDFSTDDYLVSITELQQIAENQQPDPMAVAQVEKVQSEAERNKADAVKKLSDAGQNEESTKIKRAEAISKIDQNSRQKSQARKIDGMAEAGMSFMRTPTQPPTAPGQVMPNA